MTTQTLTLEMLRSSLEARDRAIAVLGGLPAVRDLARDTLWDLADELKSSATYGIIAELSRRIAALAEAIEAADLLIETGRMGTLEYGPHYRDLHAARMLVWAMVTSGPEVAAVLMDALGDRDVDAFDAFAVADLVDSGMDPETARQVVEDTYVSPKGDTIPDARGENGHVR